QYLYWMNKSADQKNLRAHFHLGIFYKDSQAYINYEKAEKHLKYVADAGNAEAQLLLGKMYKDGLGTKQNYQKAREYLQKSADQGNAEAAFLTATLYALGQGGAQNYQIAYTYAKKCEDNQDNPLIKLLESKIKQK
ncbi:MAG: sel1 repeat family protein, partial [Alphaproteobacteria bacterium]|nr:sel1 repeat family protein [Alphaproteobacteria bacterium]